MRRDFRAENSRKQMLFILTIVHQYCSKQSDQRNQNGSHANGILQVPHEQLDVVLLPRVLRNDIGPHFLFVKNVFCTKLHFILNEYFVNLQHPDTEIHIQKQHGHKQPDDYGYEQYKHALLFLIFRQNYVIFL